jgi:hypothetical protein
MRELVSESGHNVRGEEEGAVICERVGEGRIRWMRRDFVRIAMLMRGSVLAYTKKCAHSSSGLLPRRPHRSHLALELERARA